MKDRLQQIVKSKLLTLYEIIPETTTDSENFKQQDCRRYIASTPQIRSISNGPTIAGINYMGKLCEVCTEFRNFNFGFKEREVLVTKILRGVLNFGLRDTLTNAYGWYRYNTSFFRVQRARDDQDEEPVHMMEKGYKKIFPLAVTSLAMGDVVAWAVGSIVALVGSGLILRVHVAVLSTALPALTGMVVSIVIYLLLKKFADKPGAGIAQ